jgi:hypothetical protein
MQLLVLVIPDAAGSTSTLAGVNDPRLARVTFAARRQAAGPSAKITLRNGARITEKTWPFRAQFRAHRRPSAKTLGTRPCLGCSPCRRLRRDSERSSHFVCLQWLGSVSPALMALRAHNGFSRHCLTRHWPCSLGRARLLAITKRQTRFALR